MTNYEAQIEYVGQEKYDAFYDGHRLVEGSREPGLDLCRILKAKGLHGLLTIRCDGKARFICNIDKAAELRVSIDNAGNTVFRKSSV